MRLSVLQTHIFTPGAFCQSRHKILSQQCRKHSYQSEGRISIIQTIASTAMNAGKPQTNQIR